jgi:predicted extracellular nuclease
MRRFRSLVVVCLLVLAFAQACLGRGPATATLPAASGTPASAAPSPSGAVAPTTGAAPASPVPTSTISAQPTSVMTPTRPVGSASPSPTATPGAGPTATTPRLGIDPPGTPRAASPTVVTPSPVVSGREATIAQVQGNGSRSPLAGQTVRIVGAIVTADFQQLSARGFFVQERKPSAADSSTGIFVFQGDRATPDVKLGDEVTVIGVVRETSDRTEIDISLAASTLTIVSSGNPLPPPQELVPPPLAVDARAYFERYEGMLVGLPTALVVGPTNAFGEFVVVRQDTGARRVFGDNPDGLGWRVVVDDEAGVRYDVAVGDQIDGIVGPLDYSFGQYKVQQLPEPRLVVAAPARLPPAFPQAGEGEFTITSFNLENLFDPIDTPNKEDPCDRDASGRPCRERITQADYALKLSKAGQAIRSVLGGPTIVAVQEVESLEVLKALAASPDLAPLGYEAVLLEGLDPRGIDVGLLYRRDRVVVTGVYQRNACVTNDYGFGDSAARCSSRGDGQLDGYYLAYRPPLVVSMSVLGPAGEFPLTAIVAHFTSRTGTDPEGKEFTSRRTEEARLVAGIVNDLLAADPDAAIVVLGDLNDFTDSDPLRLLTTTTPLQNLTLQVPAAERYSYIYNGQSQVLDHILVTPGLRSRLLRVTFAHLNADYPRALADQPLVHRVSDHDPPLARFRLP